MGNFTKSRMVPTVNRRLQSAIEPKVWFKRREDFIEKFVRAVNEMLLLGQPQMAHGVAPLFHGAIIYKFTLWR
jgi:hypothetical protein